MFLPKEVGALDTVLTQRVSHASDLRIPHIVTATRSTHRGTPTTSLLELDAGRGVGRLCGARMACGVGTSGWGWVGWCVRTRSPTSGRRSRAMRSSCGPGWPDSSARALCGADDMTRSNDGKRLATAATCWAFVNYATGMPARVPPEIIQSFVLVELSSTVMGGPPIEFLSHSNGKSLTSVRQCVIGRVVGWPRPTSDLKPRIRSAAMQDPPGLVLRGVAPWAVPRTALLFWFRHILLCFERPALPSCKAGFFWSTCHEHAPRTIANRSASWSRNSSSTRAISASNRSWLISPSS